MMLGRVWAFMLMAKAMALPVSNPKRNGVVFLIALLILSCLIGKSRFVGAALLLTP